MPATTRHDSNFNELARTTGSLNRPRRAHGRRYGAAPYPLEIADPVAMIQPPARGGIPEPLAFSKR
jgi:hypothetical protein